MSALSRFLRQKGILPKKNAGQPKFDYIGDGVGVIGKSLDFLKDPKFVAAWEFTSKGNDGSWPGGTPDVRWRAHMACWAASHGLNLEGDFVECGVNTGLFSMTLCHYLDFDKIDKNLYLFDTYAGIPLQDLSGAELEHAQEINSHYFDCFAIATENFKSYPNAKLVKGMLPQSLAEAPLGKIAYLSVDLNNSVAEKGVIEALWPRLTPSAIVLIDDYAFAGLGPQKAMWDAFARSQNRMVATLPTGQGLLIR